MFVVYIEPGFGGTVFVATAQQLREWLMQAPVGTIGKSESQWLIPGTWLDD